MPKTYRPKIGMIGTGGISASHLDAYRTAGWEVAALWNRTRSKADDKAATYCPQARIEGDWQAILANSDIDVVDITLHPEHRAPVIKAALEAGKHVLSQKPFVTDLGLGEDLVKLAWDKGVKLAVNQNGRWAPHKAFMREAVRAGLIGDVLSAHIAIHWDHGWTAGTSFDAIEIWSSPISVCTGLISSPRSSATARKASSRRHLTPKAKPTKCHFWHKRWCGSTVDRQSLVFDGGVPHGPRDTSYVGGTLGSLQSDGPDLGQQTVTMTTPDGIARPNWTGNGSTMDFRARWVSFFAPSRTIANRATGQRKTCKVSRWPLPLLKAVSQAKR